LFANVIIRSSDHGASWSEPVIGPNDRYRGTECASLTALLSSDRILLNQWRFHWIDLDLAYPLANDSTGEMLERLVERKVLPPSLARKKLNLKFPRELLRGLALSPEIDAFSRAIADPDSFIAFARDGGETWDTERTIRIRGGLPNKDLGYPCTILDADGSLFTVYYGQDADGVTCIMATRWRL